jgi:hypothetical protein
MHRSSNCRCRQASLSILSRLCPRASLARSAAGRT